MMLFHYYKCSCLGRRYSFLSRRYAKTSPAILRVQPLFGAAADAVLEAQQHSRKSVMKENLRTA